MLKCRHITLDPTTTPRTSTVSDEQSPWRHACDINHDQGSISYRNDIKQGKLTHVQKSGRVTKDGALSNKRNGHTTRADLIGTYSATCRRDRAYSCKVFVSSRAMQSCYLHQRLMHTSFVLHMFRLLPVASTLAWCQCWGPIYQFSHGSRSCSKSDT